jgi:hypothetical protein
MIVAVKRLWLTLVGLVAAGAALAPAASASVTIGPLTPPTITCLSLGGSATFLQLGLGGGTPNTVPFNGVITAWQVRSGDNPMSNLVFKVGRATTPAGSYTIVGETIAGPQTPNAVSTTPARIPVHAGDVIGMAVHSGDCLANGSTGDSLGSAGGDVPPGDTQNFADDTQERLPIAAVVEPDADGDGYGDETQDKCPGSASSIADCSPPKDVTPPSFSTPSASSKLSKKGAISFALTSSEPATGTATGTISLPKTARSVRFSTSNFKLAPGQFTSVTLKLPKSGAKAVRKALAHRTLKADITFTLTDSAGNKAVKVLKFKVRR